MALDPNAYFDVLVSQFSTNVILASQQYGSKLLGTVMVDQIEGMEKHYDVYGARPMVSASATRFEPTPVNGTPKDSRRLTVQKYSDAELFDSFDVERMLNDPTSATVKMFGGQIGRLKDKIIIDALLGNAQVGRVTSTNTALPAGNIVAVNDHTYDAAGGSANVGLTSYKLRKAAAIFGANNVIIDRESNPAYLVTNVAQVQNMLSQAEVASSDYAQLSGILNTNLGFYAGFNFIVVADELLPKVSTTRTAIAYTANAGIFGLTKDATMDVSKRYDLSGATQIYWEMFAGAMRKQETEVVSIACLES